MRVSHNMDSNQCFFFLGPVKSNKAGSFGSEKKEQPKGVFQRWSTAKPSGKNKSLISLLTLLVLLVSLPLSQNLFAEGSSSPGYRTMDSHQHGLAELRLLLEEQRIEIEFESPAFNLVGFEHKASNPEEKSLVRNVEAILASPAPLMSLKGGACSLGSSQVDVSSIIGGDDEHDHEAKHEHQDKHEHAYEDKTSHADISASYSFSCDNLRGLKYVEVNFFDIFSGLESIKGVWVSETSQGAAQLTDSNRRLYPK